MKLNDLKNARVAIWGMGREGLALAKLFNEKGIAFSTLLPENEHTLPMFEVVFKSPGISLYHPAIAQAKNTLITSGTNLYMANKPTATRTIAVTGTKGKSTTASLIAHCLTKLGYRVGFGGNIGRPLIDFWEQDLDFIVAELSSYQCADLSYGFDVSVVTNLYPEHLNWHKTHTQYYVDKLHLLAVRKTGQIAILNANNDLLNKLTQGIKDVCYFTSYDTQTPLLGAHNRQNMDAVRMTLNVLGIKTEITPLVQDFRPLPHRLEVFEKKGITYVDDSISTTPETAIAALECFVGRRRFLLVGGFDRGQDYAALEDYALKQHIVLIGLPDTGRRIASATYQAADVADAVRYAKSQARQGDVVILSPAAPSYNLYRNFEARGKDFKEQVLAQNEKLG